MTSATPIRVVTVRLDTLSDLGLQRVFDGEKDLHIVRAAVDARELETAVAALEPHLLVIGLAHLASPVVLERLRAIRPGLGVVVLAREFSHAAGNRLLGLGLTVCSVHASPDDLLGAIRRTAEGDNLIVPDGVSQGAARSAILTPREWEVLQLIQSGGSLPQIASALHIAVGTARTHLKNIRRKLGQSMIEEVVTDL